MPFVENYDHLKPLLAREIKTDFIARLTALGDAAMARKTASARPAALGALTQREFEIVALMAQRLSNREIAERLFLSEGSVKQYVNQIYSKLHIEGDTRTKRAQLAALLQGKIPNLWLMVIPPHPPYNACTVDLLFLRKGGRAIGPKVSHSRHAAA
ncbi:MAG: LuxR C-terminal-related transcriptional regulator [Dysosmobacter sp.]